MPIINKTSLRKKKIAKIAYSNGFECKISNDSIALLKENLLIRVKYTGDFNDVKLVEKATKVGSEYLNETFADPGYFSLMGSDANIEYKILPFNKSLEQKTNKRQEGINRNKNRKIIHIGDFVRGKVIGTGEEAKGQIQRFIRDMENDIKEVVILEQYKGYFVHLDPKTVKLGLPEPLPRINRSLINQANFKVGPEINGGRSY